MARNRAGWHRVMVGCYRYTNAAGKTLALVDRQSGFWNVRVYPMGDPARDRLLREPPRTYREAKALAQTEYIAATRAEIKRENDELDAMEAAGLIAPGTVKRWTL